MHLCNLTSNPHGCIVIFGCWLLLKTLRIMYDPTIAQRRHSWDAVGEMITGPGSPRPLEVLCGQSPASVGSLGKAIGDPLVLRKVPGSLSIPVIQVIAGLAVIGLSFYYINRTNFIAVLPALVGLGFFFFGLNRLKSHDRRVRRVQLHQRGLSHQLGDQTVAIPYQLIELATLEAERVDIRGVTVGTLHQLTISCQGKIYPLSSFEPRGMPVHETDRFVLWARKAIERIS